MCLKEKLKIAKKMYSKKKNLYNDFFNISENQESRHGLLEKMKLYRKFIAIYKNSIAE